jgi:hypothetical protein
MLQLTLYHCGIHTDCTESTQNDKQSARLTADLFLHEGPALTSSLNGSLIQRKMSVECSWKLGPRRLVYVIPHFGWT